MKIHCSGLGIWRQVFRPDIVKIAIYLQLLTLKIGVETAVNYLGFVFEGPKRTVFF